MKRYNNKLICLCSDDTKGVSWALPVRNHLMLLYVLGNLANSMSIVSLSTLTREKICKTMGWSSYKSLTNGLSALLKHGVLMRINGSRNDFYLNRDWIHIGYE